MEQVPRIRCLNLSDLETIKLLHDKHYKSEFELPDLEKNFLSTFAVEDEGKIILAGGVRTIAEAVLITDKEIGISKRRQALYQALYASMFISSQYGYDQVHAFVNGNNDKWKEHLIKKGFRQTKFDALILETTNGKR